MSETPVTVQQIDIYPIKSLDACSVSEMSVLSSGALEYDRRWAIVNSQGKLLNGKSTPALHLVRSQFDFNNVSLTLTFPDETTLSKQHFTFDLSADKEKLEEVFSQYLGETVQVQENHSQGFPDDEESLGPTVIGSATLELILQWFPGLTVENIHRRFRTNLILKTEEPFWEDRLFGTPTVPQPFSVGETKFLGINPCQRCIVPARDPETGERWAGFQKEFARLREESLPDHLDKSHFNHYYRLAVNTRLAPENEGSKIHCGDSVSIL